MTFLSTPLPALPRSAPRAFTLIELLIVVAIIAILAAIAVPNFLEAQTRAKVSRAKSDLRTIATGLESYRTDSNGYPPNVRGDYNIIPYHLTTPVAYLSTARLLDPFKSADSTPPDPGVNPEFGKLYTYTLPLTAAEAAGLPSFYFPPPEGFDDISQNPGARHRYGAWRLVSWGPDRKYRIQFPPVPQSPFNPNPMALIGADVPYDPSNGTVSLGNLLRTQRAGDQPPI